LQQESQFWREQIGKFIVSLLTDESCTVFTSSSLSFEVMRD